MDEELAQHEEPDAGLLAGLGVTAQAAEKVEDAVLQQVLAHERTEEEDAAQEQQPDAGRAQQQQQQELAQRLRTVKEEVAAVHGALNGVLQQQGQEEGDAAVALASGAGLGGATAAAAAGAVGEAHTGGQAGKRRFGSRAKKPQPSALHVAVAVKDAVGATAGGREASGDDEDGQAGAAAGPSGGAASGLQLHGAMLQARLAALQEEQGKLQALLDAGGGKHGPGALPPLPPQQGKRSRQEAAAAKKERSVRPAAKLLDDDELFAAEGEVAPEAGRRTHQGQLVETERDRLIRTGMLTPFDRLQGFERRMVAGSSSAAGGAGTAAAPGGTVANVAPWLNRRGISDLAAQVGRSGRSLQDSIRQTARKAQALKEGRPGAQLLDASQLPKLEPEARRLPAHFWHQAASGKKLPAGYGVAAGGQAGSPSGGKKRRRHSTLPRQRRKGRRVGTTRRPRGSGRQEAGGEDEGEEDGEGEEEEEEEGEEAEEEGEGAGAGVGEGRRRGAGRARGGGRDGGDGGSDGDEGSSGSGSSEYVPSGEEGEHEEADEQMELDSEPEAGIDGGSRTARGGRGRRGRGRRRGSGRRGSAGPSDGGGEEEEEEAAAEEGVDMEEEEEGEGVSVDDAAEYDDEDDEYFERRLERAVDAGFLASPRAAGVRPPAGGEGEGKDEEEEEVVFDGGFKVPARVYGRLFPYQQTAVKWLWELHTQKAGGILGDEMGLGKTIQLIAFLSGLLRSGLFRPSLVVCPATVLRQWVRELRRWAPAFRVVVLHDSARSPGGGTRPSRPELVRKATSSPSGLLLTSFESLRAHRSLLLPVRWGVAVLDEGHKIRNPDAEVTLVAKQIRTMHRIIMTGSPIQNGLSELWSLFDFIFPGKLGTLPVFQAQFSIPIQIGGYANASQLQVTTAYKCAVVLRDLIAPYLLRRRKADVNSQLPKKTEQVLFCTLTQEQRDLYRAYLSSEEVSEILAGGRKALAGIDILRKVCNHPDLLERSRNEGAEDYGNPIRSGKLTVLQRLLSHWRAGGHKALVFTQTQQMLDIVEKMVRQEGYKYHRMDGSTSISIRSRLMDDFNTNPDIHMFLLTTKVGGLGVNLTGANRVLLYDPDWNPSNDMQARERAWRIGQKRDVAIYRLITSGTIEEKVYHRQIYKSFLTNKILQDPRQKRFFTSRDIRDLFTLGDEHLGGNGSHGAGNGSSNGGAQTGGGDRPMTETARIFGSLGAGAGVEVAPPPAAPEEEGEEGAGRGLRGQGSAMEVDGEASGRERAQGGENGREAERGGGGEAGPSGRGGQGVRARSRDSSRQGAREDVGRGRRRAGTRAENGHGRGRRGGGAAAAAAGAGDGEDEDEGQAAGGTEAEDSKILRDLFDGAGIRSLVDHQKIESANDPEVLAIDREASRVAQRAAEALRRSRAACLEAPVNLPTWTGRSGGAGAPDAATPSARGGRGPAAAAGPSGRGAAAGPAALATRPRRFGNVQNPALQRRPAGDAGSSAAEGAPTDTAAGLGAGPSSSAGASAGASSVGALSSQALLARIQARRRQLTAVSEDAATAVAGAGASAGAAGPSSARPSAARGSGPGSRGGGRAGARGRGAGRGDGAVAGQGVGAASSASPGLQDAAGQAGTSATAAAPAAAAGQQQQQQLQLGGEGAEAVLKQLVAFLVAQGGEAPTSSIVEHFRSKVQESQMPVFRQLLKQVATLRKLAAGGVWVLRPEFGD